MGFPPEAKQDTEICLACLFQIVQDMAETKSFLQIFLVG